MKIFEALLALVCGLLAWIGPSFGDSFVATEGSYRWQFATFHLVNPDEFVTWLVYAATIYFLTKMAIKMMSDQRSPRAPLMMATVLFGTLVTSIIHFFLASVLYGLGLFWSFALESKTWVMTFVTSLLVAGIAMLVTSPSNDAAASAEEEKKVESI